MKNEAGRNFIQWRGVRAIKEGVIDSPKDKVALLVGGTNCNLLAKYLQTSCEVIQPQQSRLLPDSFDMAIVDIEGLRQWRDQLLDEKARQEPTFLPIVLILSNGELRHRFKALSDTVDEFIISPIQLREFTERISLLLRTRRLALAQRENLAYLVNHDRVTGLPNKNLFLEHLSDAVRDAAILKQQLHVAVVSIPMSQIMRSLGHRGLERAAAQCSKRLVQVLNNDTYVARLTTEEWGLIARPGESLARVVEVFGRVQKLSDEPVETNGERVHLAPRIGIAVHPDDGVDANTLLNNATAALSKARSATPVFYSPDVQHEALRFIRTQTGLHEALEHHQLELWYQPQISFRTGQVVGAEALVRWRLPSGQLVPPGEFVPVAEATGQICAIDRWVLEQACATMKGWQRQKLGIARISVNITVADIEAPDFVDFVLRCLRDNQLATSLLELELTETALLETDTDTLGKLHRLRDCGIRIAVDDFGTGYSSLGYLHKLPITTLKIDKAFVDNVVTSTTDAAIAETIVWLAQKFGLETVAEGVETRDQAKFLEALNVTVAQGYLYGRPMTKENLLEWMRLTGAAKAGIELGP